MHAARPWALLAMIKLNVEPRPIVTECKMHRPKASNLSLCKKFKDFLHQQIPTSLRSVEMHIMRRIRDRHGAHAACADQIMLQVHQIFRTAPKIVARSDDEDARCDRGGVPEFAT